MILVTGATGHLGLATIEYLLKKTTANNIVSFARDPQKAKRLKEKDIEVRYGTFEDSVSLDKAMQGIEKVLLIPTIDHHRLQQHKNVVDAARKAGVKYIIYTSAALKDVNTAATKIIMESHFETEDYIKQSGLTYTFLRNSLYTEVISLYVGEKVFETGILLPAGDGKVSYALRREMGEAAANVLWQNGHENKTYDITGSDFYTYHDVAKALSELSGKHIDYTDIEVSELSEQLQQAGIPEQIQFMIIAFTTDIRNHQFETVSNDLENLLGRKPTALKDAFERTLQILIYNNMKKDKTIYWTSTIIAMLSGATTAFFYYAHPFFIEAFKHLGFPAYFRIELATAKILGTVVLLVPLVPKMIKEWAYVGFAITFFSGSLAHGFVDGMGKAAFPLFSLTALIVSYYYFRKLNYAQ